MRPALSIVFFTTLSGAGYGLWVLIAIAVAIGAAPADRFTIVVALLTGLVLTSIGLLASVAHLGKPLRAWRALSQWRSSWLSREGVLALVCVPLCLLLAWRVESVHSGLRIRVGFAVFALLAAATVLCTARIYASLRTIRAWRDWRVTPLYGLLSLQTGGLWLWLLYEIATPVPAEGGTGTAAVTTAAWPLALAVGIVLSWALQRAYWRRPDEAGPDTAAATGLGLPGTVAAMEAPHSEENYLLREMGFALARRHAERLRAIASRTLFVLPLLAIGVSLLLPGWTLPAATVATVSAMLGVFVQRWLFFAEARHAVLAYYR
ncbi:MAG: DMSO reductase [Rhodanobacter denitrificans]|uniref:DMSO reductase n=1 Tax=Rhodanobacter denitrificans TaxID=666685 RepID=A0A2W5KHC2_9GAMM|nr:MAG: DMSO reductase [Rhodanobacter denitrificans]